MNKYLKEISMEAFENLTTTLKDLYTEQLGARDKEIEVLKELVEVLEERIELKDEHIEGLEKKILKMEVGL